MNRLTSRVLVTLVICVPLFAGGCASVMQRIQETTGSRIENVDQLADEERAESVESEGTSAKRQDVPKSPAPHIELSDILRDEGRGEYAGDRYDRSRVLDALTRMPKGLAEDKAYAYLLGLVGENYREDVSAFDSMKNPDYRERLNAWKAYGAKEPPPEQEPPEAKQAGDQQQQPEPKKLNVVILLDASGSMGGKLGDKTKMEWAKQAIDELARSIPADTGTLQVRVFGHKGSNKTEDKELSCSVTESVYGPEKPDPLKVKPAVDAIKATGYTPLALAIQEAGKSLPQGEPGTWENQLIVISDGYENCGGDPVRAAREVHRSKALTGIHVIALDTDEQASKDLEQLAEVTGGNFQPVEKPEDLQKTLADRGNGFKNYRQPWAIRALNSLVEAHRMDERRLNRQHSMMVEKARQEYTRLDEANDFIKAQGKIDAKAWKEIGSWIDHRWKQLGGYADLRWKEIGTQLNREWLNGFREIRKEWERKGGEGQMLDHAAKSHESESLFRQMFRDYQSRGDVIRVEPGDVGNAESGERP
ncbi:vWA domain-containing protein [Staphylospora marina]|uniref:vWA domain-containing protein n=1 Tax=Staphylospora marina TaxID=2490858 RepID=UPI000F5BF051|nr:VWA domain-containing protein [Staphylospora marina]